jgi:hypothetical protein
MHAYKVLLLKEKKRYCINLEFTKVVVNKRG